MSPRNTVYNPKYTSKVASDDKRNDKTWTKLLSSRSFGLTVRQLGVNSGITSLLLASTITPDLTDNRL